MPLWHNISVAIFKDTVANAVRMRPSGRVRRP